MLRKYEKIHPLSISPLLRGRKWGLFRNFVANQSGITLVLAIIMLFSVTFISFMLSTIIIREIKTARLILKTEPAISAANSGGEVGLYQFLGGTGGVNTTGSLVESSATYQVVADLYDNPYNFSLNVESAAVVKVPLYDAENPDNQNADYGSVTIKNISGWPIKVEIFSWSDPANAFCQSPAIVGGGEYTCSALNRLDDRYLLVINLIPGAKDAIGQITATNNAGQPKGLPSDSPTLMVTGTNGDVQRKLEIKL